MKPLPVTYLRARLLAQFERARKKGDRAAMLILSSRLHALRAAA